MLRAIATEPGVSNEALATLTGTDITAVSRTGRRLQQRGLAQPTRHGRSNAWGVTPYGAEIATTLDPPAVQGVQLSLRSAHSRIPTVVACLLGSRSRSSTSET